MRLYNYWRSSSSWRVRIALAWKGLSYEYRPVNLIASGGEQNAPSFQALNAMTQVPLLELDDGVGPPRRLSQSMAILEYLEERFPTPPLLPPDPWRRARTRQMAEIVNSGIQPLQNLPVLHRVRDQLRCDERVWFHHFVERGLRALEGIAQEESGTFLIGGQPTLADVLVVPQLYNARRYQLELSHFPTLLRVEAACLALPAFADTHPDRHPDAIK